MYIVKIISGIAVQVYQSTSIPSENDYEISQEQFESISIPCKVTITDNGLEFGEKVDYSEIPKWQEVIESEIEYEEPDPTPEERIAALEEENARLQAQITAQSEQMDFYEECIVEMAAVVYA